MALRLCPSACLCTAPGLHPAVPIPSFCPEAVWVTPFYLLPLPSVPLAPALQSDLHVRSAHCPPQFQRTEWPLAAAGSPCVMWPRSSPLLTSLPLGPLGCSLSSLGSAAPGPAWPLGLCPRLCSCLLPPHPSSLEALCFGLCSSPASSALVPFGAASPSAAGT